jgi:small subunit ribosomal protein S17
MANTTSAPAAGTDTAPKGRVLTGIVTRDKMNKTRRVEIQRLVRHPKYGKFVKQRTVCYTHDEGNDSHLGDTVEIRESRPLSKLKRWTLVRVVTRAPSRTVANLEGSVAGNELSAEAAAKAAAVAAK